MKILKIEDLLISIRNIFIDQQNISVLWQIQICTAQIWADMCCAEASLQE